MNKIIKFELFYSRHMVFHKRKMLKKDVQYKEGGGGEFLNLTVKN